WSRLLLEFGVSWGWPFDCNNVLHVAGINSQKGRRKKLWNVTVIAILWALWMERNNRIFDDDRGNLESIWDRIKHLVALWVYKNNSFKEVPNAVPPIQDGASPSASQAGASNVVTTPPFAPTTHAVVNITTKKLFQPQVASISQRKKS
ncbi:hypothetical protein TorRG33x02_275330, partial [Trema orientale]